MRYCYLISIGVACLLFCTACGSGGESSSEEKLTPAETQMQEIQETEPEMQSETEKSIIAQIYANPDEEEEYISLYAEPDAESTALARLYLNDTLGVYSLENDWYYVQFDSLEGYVPANAVSMTEIVPDVTNVPAPELNSQPEQTYTVSFSDDDIFSASGIQRWKREFIALEEIHCDNGTAIVEQSPEIDNVDNPIESISVVDATAGIVTLTGTIGHYAYDANQNHEYLGSYPFTIAKNAGDASGAPTISGYIDVSAVAQSDVAEYHFKVTGGNYSYYNVMIYSESEGAMNL